jgi:hypothetical protein
MAIICILAGYRSLNVYPLPPRTLLLQALYKSILKAVMDQLVIRYSVIVSYCRQNENAMVHRTGYVYTSIKPYSHSVCYILYIYMKRITIIKSCLN